MSASIACASAGRALISSATCERSSTSSRLALSWCASQSSTSRAARLTALGVGVARQAGSKNAVVVPAVAVIDLGVGDVHVRECAELEGHFCARHQAGVEREEVERELRVVLGRLRETRGHRRRHRARGHRLRRVVRAVIAVAAKAAVPCAAVIPQDQRAPLRRERAERSDHLNRENPRVVEVELLFHREQSAGVVARNPAATPRPRGTSRRSCRRFPGSRRSRPAR